MPDRNVFNKLSEAYYELTFSEKKVADYVTSRQDGIQYMSITELAEACEVAESTISRFCRSLGYKGYNIFKLAIANSYSEKQKSVGASGDINPEDSIFEMSQKLYNTNMEAMAQTQLILKEESIKAAADVLLSAGKVLCMGQGGSAIMAQEAAHLFSTSLPNFFPVVESHLQAIAAGGLTERDAVIYFSYSGSTRDLEDALTIIKSRGAKIVLVTRFPKSPGAMNADIVLQCGSNENPLQHGSVAARIAQLYLLDVLSAEMCARDPQRCEDYRESIAEALSIKHI